MKRKTYCLRVGLAVIVTAAISIVGSPSVMAQGDSKNAEAADPFLRTNSGAKVSPKKPDKELDEAFEKAKAPEMLQNVAQVVAFIEVSHDDFRKWMKANPGSPDGDALRAEVQKWIDAGDAEILASQMLMGRSGNRSKVESIRELFYPTEFDPAQWSPSAPYGVAFDIRNLGATIEADPIIEIGGRITTNLAPEYVEYIGEGVPRPEPEGVVQAGDVRIPLVHIIRPTLSVESAPGEWRLLTVETARSEKADLTGNPVNPKRCVLVMSRSSINAFEVPAPEDAGKVKRWGHLQAEWIDVDAGVTDAWLRKKDFGAWIGDKAEARIAVEAMVEKGKAEVVFTRMLPFRSGQRAKSESVREVIYPTEYDQSEQFSLSRPRGLETRNTGTTLEVDPVVAAGGGVVDLNFVAETVDLVGQSVSQRYFDQESKQWKPDEVMPIFYTNRETTQVSLLFDQSLLVGVMMPHDADGQPDRSKRRLLFMKVMK